MGVHLVLCLCPAGGGKSMTFQLPPLAKDNCFTVVIGPLLALMKDQVPLICTGSSHGVLPGAVLLLQLHCPCGHVALAS